MATHEKPIVLDYSPPPGPPPRHVFGIPVYVVALAWMGVLLLGLVAVSLANTHGLRVFVAAALTAGTGGIVGLLLRSVGRAGCVTVFLVLSIMGVAVIWLAI